MSKLIKKYAVLKNKTIYQWFLPIMLFMNCFLNIAYGVVSKNNVQQSKSVVPVAAVSAHGGIVQNKNVPIVQPPISTVSVQKNSTMSNLEALKIILQPVMSDDITKMIQGIQAKTTDIDKIQAAESLLQLTTIKTEQIDKDKIITLYKGFYYNHYKMTKPTLVALLHLLQGAIQNQYLLSVEQLKIVQKQILMVTEAISIATDTIIVLDVIKGKLSTIDKDFKGCLSIMSYIISLLDDLDFKLDAKDLNNNEKKGLLGLLYIVLPTMYNQRSALYANGDTVKKLKEIFIQALSNKILSKVVSNRWVDTLNFGIIFNSANTIKIYGKKIDALIAMIPLLTTTVNDYEKKLFCGIPKEIFSVRKDRSLNELLRLSSLLDAIVKKNDNYCDKNYKDSFLKLISILSVTYKLMVFGTNNSSKDKIKALDDIVQIIISIQINSMDYEIILLVKIIDELFAVRGEMDGAALSSLQGVLKNIIQGKISITLPQVALINTYIEELTSAITVTINKASYIEALIDMAIVNKNIAQLSKVVDLFTSNMNNIKPHFVEELNIFIKDKNIQNDPAFYDLCKKIDAKKLDGVSMLTDQQRATLIEWLKINQQNVENKKI